MNSENTDKITSLIRLAMADDEKIDDLEKQLLTLKKSRAVHLEQILKLGTKKFEWKGRPLTIFRKGEGLHSLRGKSDSTEDVLKVD